MPKSSYAIAIYENFFSEDESSETDFSYKKSKFRDRDFQQKLKQNSSLWNYRKGLWRTPFGRSKIQKVGVAVQSSHLQIQA
jgi:hypothetical protein